MKKDHVFRIVNTLDTVEIYPTVEMEIDSQASMTDMIEAFESFLRAVGYYPKENSYLTFISNVEDI